MPRFTIVKFKNMSPLHIGNGKENYDFSAAQLQSDTVSAALAAMKVQTGGGNGLEAFMESFVVSSAFPYSGRRFFLPKPQGKLAATLKGEEEHSYRKDLKSLKYIELELWKDLIKGRPLELVRGQLAGEFLLAEPSDGMGTVCKSQVSQRVQVSRDGRTDASPFFFEWKFYHPDAGLYCLLQAPDDKRDEIVRLFARLGEEGIGTDRSVGGGRFEVETEQLDIAAPTDADATMLLSVYLPAEDEIARLQLHSAKYNLVRRGGYMAGSQEETFRHLLKKSVYMFDAGSVFATTDTLKGKIADLRPEWNDSAMHPVFRSGMPISIPIKQQSV